MTEPIPALQTLAYQSPGVKNRPPANRRTAACVVVIACIVIGINAFLLSIAAADHSWGALSIMMFIGPITNGITAILSCALFPIVRLISRGATVKPYIFASIVLPIVAIIVDAGCVLSMDLHGC